MSRFALYAILLTDALALAAVFLAFATVVALVLP